MKKILNMLAAALFVGCLVPTAMTSCTDNGGDGIDSVLWNGSQNPENTSFRNPVWEPSLEAGTVVKGASMFVAVSATSQWAPGLTYVCKALTSNNLMTWNAAGDTFTASPAWGEGRVNSLSVDYARTVTGATYWMFYTLEGADGIGAASATAAAGPYTDRGTLLTAESLGKTSVRNPFFIVITTNFYLCYTTDDGTYIQKLRLNKNSGASLSGAPERIASEQFDDVAIVRASSSRFYLMGTVSSGGQKEIRYAMASKVTGPYADRSGVELTAGSTGEQLVAGGSEMANPENPMRGFVNAAGTHLFLAYNATEQGKEVMQSGYARRPMLVTPFEIADDGWLAAPATAQKGWTSPRYE